MLATVQPLATAMVEKQALDGSPINNNRAIGIVVLSRTYRHNSWERIKHIYMRCGGHKSGSCCPFSNIPLERGHPKGCDNGAGNKNQSIVTQVWQFFQSSTSLYPPPPPARNSTYVCSVTPDPSPSYSAFHSTVPNCRMGGMSNSSDTCKCKKLQLV
jgi:hypothetical protein